VDDNYYPLHNKSNDFLIDRAVQRSYNFTGIVGTGNQDMAAQVCMGPITDRTKEQLGVTDVGIIEMRRLLLTSAKDLCEGREPTAAHNADAFSGVQGVSLVRKCDISLDECVNDAFGSFDRTRQRTQALRQSIE
jgi:hypothetical protein